MRARHGQFALGVMLTPLLAAGLGSPSGNFLEHACLDNVHGGVFLSDLPGW